jgi:Holliday junction resolvase
MKIQHRISNDQEEDVCEQMMLVYPNVVRQAGSGNQLNAPNDVLIKGEAYIECKATNAKEMKLHFAWLERVRRLAQLSGLRAYVALQFSKESSSQYYVVEDVDFIHLLRCEQELRALTISQKPIDIE